jgi:hypothetical protein
MGLPRKGTRSIAVGGRRYRWLVSEDRDCWGLSVYIEQDGAGGQRLLISFFYPEAGPTTAALAQVTPEVVRRIIVAGLARGWKPEQRGLAPLRLYPSAIRTN